VGLYEKHVRATWNLGTISAFACSRGKTKKTCVKVAVINNLYSEQDSVPAYRRGISTGSRKEKKEERKRKKEN
jgi:hypothetical protein